MSEALYIEAYDPAEEMDRPLRVIANLSPMNELEIPDFLNSTNEELEYYYLSKLQHERNEAGYGEDENFNCDIWDKLMDPEHPAHAIADQLIDKAHARLLFCVELADRNIKNEENWVPVKASLERMVSEVGKLRMTEGLTLGKFLKYYIVLGNRQSNGLKGIEPSYFPTMETNLSHFFAMDIFDVFLLACGIDVYRLPAQDLLLLMESVEDIV